MRLRTANTRHRRRMVPRWVPVLAFTLTGSFSGSWEVGAIYSRGGVHSTYSRPPLTTPKGDDHG